MLAERLKDPETTREAFDFYRIIANLQPTQLELLNKVLANFSQFTLHCNVLTLAIIMGINELIT